MLGVSLVLPIISKQENIAIAEETNNIVDRGVFHNTIDNEDGTFTLFSSISPINYLDDGNYTPINNSIYVLPQDHYARDFGYIAGTEQGLFNTFFKQNAQDSYPVVFQYERNDSNLSIALRSKLMGFGYYDPSTNNDYHILQYALNTNGTINNNVGTWSNIFTGVNATWEVKNQQIKEEIFLSNTTKTVLQNNPPSDFGFNNSESYCVFITKLDFHNLSMDNGSVNVSNDWTFNDTIYFKDHLNNTLFSFPLGFVYEQYNISNTENVISRYVKSSGNHYILSGIKATILNSMAFPVVFDPTTEYYIDSDSEDGWVYGIENGCTAGDYDTARDKAVGDSAVTTGNILCEGYRICVPDYDSRVLRAFFQFNTSGLPTGATVSSATINLTTSTKGGTNEYFAWRNWSQDDSDIDVYDYGNVSDLRISDMVDCPSTSTEYTWTLNQSGYDIIEDEGINDDYVTISMSLSDYDLNGSTMPEESSDVGHWFDESAGSDKPVLAITYTSNSAPVLSSFSVDPDHVAGVEGWDQDEDNVQVDFNIDDDDDTDKVWLLMNFSKGGTPTTPSNTSYHAKYWADNTTGNYTQNNVLVDWDFGTWTDYDGTVKVRAVLWDGSDYSASYIDDTNLDGGIDGISPDTPDDFLDIQDTTVSNAPSETWIYFNDTTSGIDNARLLIRNNTDGTRWEFSSNTWIVGSDTNSFNANDSSFDCEVSEGANFNFTDEGVTWGAKQYQLKYWVEDCASNTKGYNTYDTFTLTSEVWNYAVSCNGSTGGNVTIKTFAVSCNGSTGGNITSKTFAVSCNGSTGGNITSKTFAVSCNGSTGGNITSKTFAVSCNGTTGGNATVPIWNNVESCLDVTGGNVTVKTYAISCNGSTGGNITTKTFAVSCNGTTGGNVTIKYNTGVACIGSTGGNVTAKYWAVGCNGTTGGNVSVDVWIWAVGCNGTTGGNISEIWNYVISCNGTTGGNGTAQTLQDVIDTLNWMNETIFEGGDSVDIGFEAELMSIALTVGLFFFFFIVGYRSDKRSGGAFMLVSGFMLIGLEYVTATFLNALYIVPLLSPVAIFIIILGVRKWLYVPEGERTKSEGR